MHEPDGKRIHEMTDGELTGLLQALRCPEDVTPRAGFYARVMDRIEQQQENSIWSVFLEPVFSKRLVFASAMLMVLMGLFLATSAPDQEEILAFDNAPVWVNEHDAAPVLGQPVRVDALRAAPVSLMDAEHGRDAVFADIISYQEH